MTKVLPPDPENRNNDRATWAETALLAFRQATGVDCEDALADLLCDLMHLADRKSWHFGAEMDRAKVHYEAETTPDAPMQRYRVLYAVTRSEYYEIAASSAKEAEDRAFDEAELMDHMGETTSVVACDAEEITR
jgi:hypothetical protein